MWWLVAGAVAAGLGLLMLPETKEQKRERERRESEAFNRQMEEQRRMGQRAITNESPERRERRLKAQNRRPGIGRSTISPAPPRHASESESESVPVGIRIADLCLVGDKAAFRLHSFQPDPLSRPYP